MTDTPATATPPPGLASLDEGVVVAPASSDGGPVMPAAAWLGSATEDGPDTAVLDADASARVGEQYARCRGAIRHRASFKVRHLRGHARQEALAEIEAFAWYAFLRLAARGDDPAGWVSTVVDFAAGRYKEGRRFAGRVPLQDALSEEGRRRRGQLVASLPLGDGDKVPAEVRAALRHRAPGPAAEAILRADWEEFQKTLTARERALVGGLEAGMNLTEIAQQQGVSKAATQDMRRTVARKWAARGGYQDTMDR
jgi:hypothetical protein